MPDCAADDSQRAWDLYADWCAAHDELAVLPTRDSLDRFFSDVPCADTTRQRREAQILSLCHPSNPNRPQVRVPEKVEDVGRSLEALGRIATGDAWADEYQGWVGRFRATRDAFVLALVTPTDLGGAGLSLDRSVQLDAAIEAISTMSAPLGCQGCTGEARCPGCAVGRWLSLWDTALRWGRSVIREELAGSMTRRKPAPGCWEMPAGLVESAATFIPAIDPHGWPTEWRAMSRRSVTASLIRIRGLGELSPAPDTTDHHQVPGSEVPELDFSSFDRRLEAAVTGADELNDRISQWLEAEGLA